MNYKNLLQVCEHIGGFVAVIGFEHGSGTFPAAMAPQPVLGRFSDVVFEQFEIAA